MEMKVNTDVRIITVKVTRENYYDTFLIEWFSYFMIALNIEVTEVCIKLLQFSTLK